MERQLLVVSHVCRSCDQRHTTGFDLEQHKAFQAFYDKARQIDPMANHYIAPAAKVTQDTLPEVWQKQALAFADKMAEDLLLESLFLAVFGRNPVDSVSTTDILDRTMPRQNKAPKPASSFAEAILREW